MHDGAEGICPAKQRPLPRERIEIWRSHDRMADGAEAVAAKLIRHHQQDVGPRCAGGSNRRHRGEDNCEEAERCLHAYRSPLFIGAGRRLECMDAGNRNCAFRAKRTGCSQAESYIIEHHVVSPGRSERAPSCPRAVHNARQVATAAARGVSGSTLGWANSVLPPPEAGLRQLAGSNNSTGFPSGSSICTWLPAGPDSTSLRKRTPACFRVAMHAGRSVVWRTRRFHPPGS